MFNSSCCTLKKKTRPESLRFDVCLPELIEVSKEGGYGLKNCDGTIEVVEDFLKKEKLVNFRSGDFTLPSAPFVLPPT